MKQVSIQTGYSLLLVVAAMLFAEEPEASTISPPGTLVISAGDMELVDIPDPAGPTDSEQQSSTSSTSSNSASFKNAFGSKTSYASQRRNRQAREKAQAKSRDRAQAQAAAEAKRREEQEAREREAAARKARSEAESKMRQSLQLKKQAYQDREDATTAAEQAAAYAKWLEAEELRKEAERARLKAKLLDLESKQKEALSRPVFYLIPPYLAEILEVQRQLDELGPASYGLVNPVSIAKSEAERAQSELTQVEDAAAQADDNLELAVGELSVAESRQREAEVQLSLSQSGAAVAEAELDSALVSEESALQEVFALEQIDDAPVFSNIVGITIQGLILEFEIEAYDPNGDAFSFLFDLNDDGNLDFVEQVAENAGVATARGSFLLEPGAFRSVFSITDSNQLSSSFDISGVATEFETASASGNSVPEPAPLASVVLGWILLLVSRKNRGRRRETPGFGFSGRSCGASS